MDYTNYIKKILLPVTKDNTSGSTDIALKAIKLIKKFVKRKDVKLSPELYKCISQQLISAQPSMGIMFNLAYRITKMKTLVEKRDFLLYLDKYRDEIEAHKIDIAKRVFNLIKNKNVIMIYSSSSTVLESLKYAHKKGSRFKVVVPESRPMREGEKMMIQLSRSSIPVMFVTDVTGISMLAMYDIDVVLIGGDAILNKYLVSKIGTYPIAMLCKQNHIPVYGLCGTEKVIPKEYENKFVISDKPAYEITTYKNKYVKVVNRYFEKVPIKLFTGIIADQQQLKV
ncbi:MAG: hypothetical protein ACP5JP_01445 [bacterium]